MGGVNPISLSALPSLPPWLEATVGPVTVASPGEWTTSTSMLPARHPSGFSVVGLRRATGISSGQGHTLWTRTQTSLPLLRVLKDSGTIAFPDRQPPPPSNAASLHTEGARSPKHDSHTAPVYCTFWAQTQSPHVILTTAPPGGCCTFISFHSGGDRCSGRLTCPRLWDLNPRGLTPGWAFSPGPQLGGGALAFCRLG